MKQLLAAVVACSAMQLAETGPAWGQAVNAFSSGNELWTVCGSTADGPPTEGCLAYVIGSYDGQYVLRTSAHLPAQVCLPAGVTRGQLTDVVRRYLSRNPEGRQYTASSIVWIAIREAFPCQAQPAG